MTDYQGRPAWHLPKPIAYTDHEFKKLQMKEVGGEIVRVLGTEVKQVPIYKGMSASMARYERSQAKRARRKAAEKRKENG
jgi:hypothetical protein